MSEEKSESACVFSRRLSALFDGELSAAEKREVEAHLAECASCAAGLEAIRGVSVTLEAAYAPPATEEFRDRVRVAFAMRRGDAVLGLAERLTAAAAAVLVASIIYILADSGGVPERGRYEPSLAAISIEMSEPAEAEAPEEERLAKYILADLSTEGLE